jgi:hypothetical protein
MLRTMPVRARFWVLPQSGSPFPSAASTLSRTALLLFEIETHTRPPQWVQKLKQANMRCHKCKDRRYYTPFTDRARADSDRLDLLLQQPYNATHQWNPQIPISKR